MLEKQRNRGQSEIIGQLLTLAIVFLAAGLMGSFYLTSMGSTDPSPAASVDYEVNIELVSTASGDESRYVLSVTTTSMERADELTIYYNSNQEVGTLTKVNETEKIGENGNIEIQDGDTFTVVGSYQGTQNIISTYEFNEDYWSQNQ